LHYIDKRVSRFEDGFGWGIGDWKSMRELKDEQEES